MSKKWDSQNLKTIGVRLKINEAEKFIEYCKQFNKTPNAILKEYILKCINSNMKNKAEDRINNNNSNSEN